MKLLGFVAIVAVAGTLGAATPTVASAEGWRINGTELSGSAALATTAAITGYFTLSAIGVRIECTGGTLDAVNAKLKSPNTGFAESLAFQECRPQAGDGCSLEGSTIRTKPLTITARKPVEIGLGLEIELGFAPKTGTLITTLSFSGAECVMEGTQPVTGHIEAEGRTGHMERTLQEVYVNVEQSSNELHLGSGDAALNVIFLLKLAAEKPWSFM